MPARFREIHSKHRQTFYSNPSVRPMGARQQLFGRREDGIEFPVDIMLSPFRSGNDTYSVAVVRDATDRVRKDQLLKTRSNDWSCGSGSARRNWRRQSKAPC